MVRELENFMNARVILAGVIRSVLSTWFYNTGRSGAQLRGKTAGRNGTREYYVVIPLFTTVNSAGRVNTSS